MLFLTINIYYFSSFNTIIVTLQVSQDLINVTSDGDINDLLVAK